MCRLHELNLNFQYVHSGLHCQPYNTLIAVVCAMLYPYELPRPRPRPALHKNFGHNGLLLSKQPAARGTTKKTHLMLPYLKQYCNISSLHGIRYLTDPKLRSFEKVIWLLLLLATSICAILVYVDLTELYYSQRIHTTVEDTMAPIFYAPFPSVGLCPNNRVNWNKLRTAPQHFLGENVSQLDRELFEQFFIAAADVHMQRLETMSSFFQNETLAQQVTRLNNLDVSEVLHYLSFDCNEVFSECCWRGHVHNCCDIFELQRTESGYCWVFNSAVSPEMQQLAKQDKFYPRRTPKYGEGTGLDIVMRLNKTNLLRSVQGVYVMIKQPEQWSDDVKLALHDSHTKINMMPRYTSPDKRIRAIPPAMRHCIFDDEIHDPLYKKLPGLVYWKGNCRTRCHQEYVHKLCNCTPALLFPIAATDNFTDCKPAQFKCLYENRQTFRLERHSMESEYVDAVYNETMICNCLNSCELLIFDRVFSSEPLDNFLHNDLTSLRLDIFYQSAWFIKYQQRMRFTFVELLASFGGIIGLFLGASLLSAVELVYYFTVGLYYHLRDEGNMQQQASPQPLTLHFRHKITPVKILRH